MTYTVGEMAKMMNVAPSTLRYYDNQGLLPNIKRSSGGIRLFDDEDLEWLNIVECLKKTGMSIKEIKQFVDWSLQGDKTINQRLELIERQRDVIKSQMQELEKTLDALEYKQWYYETAKKAGSCKIHKTMKDEEIPERIRKIRDRLHSK